MPILIIALIGLLALLSYLRKGRTEKKQLPAGTVTETKPITTQKVEEEYKKYLKMVTKAMPVKSLKYQKIYHAYYFWNPITNKWGYLIYFNRLSKTFLIPHEIVRKIKGAVYDKNWRKATALLLYAVDKFPTYYQIQKTTT